MSVSLALDLVLSHSCRPRPEGLRDQLRAPARPLMETNGFLTPWPALSFHTLLCAPKYMLSIEILVCVYVCRAGTGPVVSLSVASTTSPVPVPGPVMQRG